MSSYAQRIGVVSLKKSIKNPASTEFRYLYESIGLNTGNFMFTNAVFRHISGDLRRLGFDFSPEIINKEFDALVVPAANWINDRADWSWLIQILEKVEVPIIPVGIGLQADTINVSDVRVSESSLRLVELFSKKSAWISCRGDFTRDWLISIGITNVVTTGCPSIYMKLMGKGAGHLSADSVVLQGTRYWISTDFVNSEVINRKIYQLAGRLDLPMIYQSEPEEIDFLVYSGQGGAEHAKSRMGILAKLYGFSEEEEMVNYLFKKGRVFFDIDEWSEYVGNCVGVIGTRLHGAIVALNSSRPARLILHDSRTQEVAEFAGIPTLIESEIENKSREDLVAILRETNLSIYLEKRKKNAIVYKHFLEACGLCPNYSDIISE